MMRLPLAGFSGGRAVRRDLLAAAVASALACATASAEVVVTGSSGQAVNTAPSATFQTGWNDTGEIQDGQLSASATYIGNGWVLTDAHVGDGNPVTFDGGATSYSWDGVHATVLTNTDSSTSDLLLYKLAGTPAGVTTVPLTTSEPAVGSTMYSFGFGLSRGSGGPQYYKVTAVGTVLTWTSPSQSNANEILYEEDTGIGSKLWGTNVISQGTTLEFNGSGNVDAFNSTFNSFGTSAPSSTTSQEIAIGDSGGGVYNAQGQLIGINDFLLAFNNQPGQSNGNGTETAAYGDGSGYNDIFDYLSQIESVTGVPEPASVSMLMLGLGGAMLRRRRS
jgi:hypothetical protein